MCVVIVDQLLCTVVGVCGDSGSTALYCVCGDSGSTALYCVCVW